jgi:peptidyl-prolyl cis-trans isomerase SurA
MKFRLALLILSLILTPVLTEAQVDGRILLSVDGKPVQAGEFIRMYKKSAEPGKKPDVEEYLQQFIIFKLKVAEAINEGYDTTETFKSELEGYRNQLAQNYLTDARTKEKLLQSAYQRSLTEVNAWHVLVGLSPDASADDTLKAWKKAMDIRERIVRGEPFDQVARSSSDDKSALFNGGNLGYFTVFQMVTPFEDAAWSLKPGAISQPVRTAFGYHIIKVADRRPSKGKIRVAHIMKNAPPGISAEDAAGAREQINEIYNKLQAGTSFSELARNLSDHKESAVNGGALDWFGTGEMISDFSEAAFSIADTGKYTEPVRTLYGWHIIKLLERRLPRNFEEARSLLESRLNQSYLNSVSRRSFVESLRKEYKYRINRDVFNWFVLNTDTLIIQGLRKYNRSALPGDNIYTFADQALSSRDFAEFIEKRGFMISTSDSVLFLNRSLETRSADHLISYENTMLEKKNPEFRYLMNEFHDGILLFEISDRKVWTRVTEDSTGLRNYYEEHKNNFLTNPGITAAVYTLRVPGGDNELAAAWKKYSGKRNADRRLMKKFNGKNDSVLVLTEGKWLRGDDPQIDGLNWDEESHYLNTDGYPSVLKITGRVEPRPLEFESVQGEMMAGYQEQIDRQWIEQLKQKYTVKIDNSVLEAVKKTLGQ